MKRPARIRALFALAVIAVSVFVAVTVPVRLGLDLRGGTQIVLETRSTETLEADAEATDRTLEVLRGRVDALGVAEPSIVRSGDQRIIVELPGVQDPRKAADVLGRTAQLSVHPVKAPGTGTPPSCRRASGCCPTSRASGCTSARPRSAARTSRAPSPASTRRAGRLARHRRLRGRQGLGPADR